MPFARQRAQRSCVIKSRIMFRAAGADEWSQRTVLTFSAPVEIPGQILPAGAYVFKLVSSQSNRHIVQVFNKEENHVFGTFLAIPNYRRNPSEKIIIRFEERAAGLPQSIKAWFYPHKNYGHEFVYPKAEALALAKANNTPIPSMPAELPANTTKTVVTKKAPEIMALLVAPLKSEQPSGGSRARASRRAFRRTARGTARHRIARASARSGWVAVVGNRGC
jgi:hypothetical protein